MRLLEFRVRNFRSINDSGTIAVTSRTALVGRNESGKSNLLMALRSLKPSEGVKPLSRIKDFPKDRRMDEFREELPVVDTRWELSIEDQAELARRWPRASHVKHVRIRRDYTSRRDVELEGLDAFVFERGKAVKAVEALAAAKGTLADRGNLLAEFGKLLEGVPMLDDPLAWAEQASGSAQAFRRYLKIAQQELDPGVTEKVDEVAAIAQAALSERDQSNDARGWILERVPVFIYLHDYPELEGHIDLEALIGRMDEDKIKESDLYFLKLMKVAGLDVRELHRLLATKHELRQHLANRGGAVVTRTVRRLWSDRALKVRFNLDDKHFDTLVSDPNQLYDVEVNLDERSRGFRWFFSFYVTFAADTEGGPAENAILLLDEPGLHLHAIGQRDLLEHFGKDFNKNQVIYTTHSPFMLPVDDIGSIRAVTIDEEKGTTVSNDASADTTTLMPLQAALGLVGKLKRAGERPS